MKKSLYLTAVIMAFSFNAYAKDVSVSIIKDSLEDIGYKFDGGYSNAEYLNGKDNVSTVRINANRDNIVNEVYLSISSTLINYDKDEIRNRAETAFLPLVGDQHGVEEWIGNCIYEQNIGMNINVDGYNLTCTMGNETLNFSASK
ncbi:MAG: hypothetical protein LBR70_03740 [Lactobacillaceae bacterium]|jgi:hypothetical protein|nr:hypothetical protein [Lactobacillaceae bacterium]